MQILGQDPRHKTSTRNIIVIIMVASVGSIFFPTTIEIYASLRNRDIDGVLECLPQIIATSITCVKILNMHFNRRNFDKLYQMVAKQWVQLKLNGELHVLEEIVMQGNKIAQFYQHTLVVFFSLFLLIPLIFPVLDIIHPLNETRTRQQLLRVNYIFFNNDDYFFYVYLHLSWGAIIVLLTVVGADWIYMLIIHHSSGLFAVCGHQVQKATTNLNYFTDKRVLENDMYENFRNCILMHKEAIRFFNILNESSQRSYMFQIGLSMLSISTTAVKTALNFNKPEEAMRSAAFCGANQFHLFLLSLPGQVLLDNCFNLTNDMYVICIK
ncbi:hypothetical protein QLX08_003063 [Tetragonisca angustula]|uniref:Odorant receptor n=1 Tax=Tetragonisca angustula TaxID=166442 RepID=A0AAW1A7Z9_9HYME